MRLPAQRSLEHQAAYPAQAEGGYPGDTCRTLKAALVAWEARRGIAVIKYGRGYRAGELRNPSAKATRAEISWNPAPEVKRESTKAKQREEARREEARNRMRRNRAQETPEARAERLAKRRAERFALNPPKPKMSPQERAQARKDAKKRYMARRKAGLIGPKPEPKRKMTPEQRARKAERQRRYESANKIQRTA